MKGLMRYFLLLLLLVGCASQPKAILDFDEIADVIIVTHSIRIPATGEYCIVEDDKIGPCRPSKETNFAETEE